MMIVKRGKYTINISYKVLSMLDSYKQKKYQNEAGGIILGYVFENDHINITKLSEPNSLDKATRYSFERNKNAAQKIVNLEFNESNGKVIYLGEWHTHPELDPSPSIVDIKMIKKQYKYNKINESFLILLIQGIENLYIAIYNGEKIIDK